MEQLFRPEVATAEAFEDVPGPPPFPEEEALIAQAGTRRRREFVTARHCAREALGELGVAPVAILRGERGAPIWPPGLVGSMTHCDGYRAAAVARRADVEAVGIDAEPHAPLPAGVLGKIAFGVELTQVEQLTADSPEICWDRLLFCAKEAVYKAWFSLTGRWLGFADAEVTLHASSGTFGARVLVTGPGLTAGFTGRWLAEAGLLITGIAVPAAPVGCQRDLTGEPSI